MQLTLNVILPAFFSQGFKTLIDLNTYIREGASTLQPCVVNSYLHDTTFLRVRVQPYLF